MEIVNRALELVKHSEDSAYKIANKTGITEATIGNYRNGKTKPTKANAMVLLQYFSNYTDLMSDEEMHQLDNESMRISKDGVINYLDKSRQYNSDSADVFRAQIEEKEILLKEKDAQIKEKDAQINKLLDQNIQLTAQINSLISMLNK
jgi:transcriptional regulator with XRE-family HTH domain